ncbi:MAG TPA: RNA polymerase sigma factor [Planctomycetota bacterium]|nr:RNA polymerase sigma factor [Planctomycetota bacterium]
MVTTLRLVPGCDVWSDDARSLPESIRNELLERGVSVEALPDESPSRFAERLDTAVMALFRDTRSAPVFEALYARTGGSVFEWLRRLLSQQRCGLDPLEVLQDTFVNVYQYSSRFRDERPESFRVWVRTIASNAFRRARAQMPRRSDRVPTEKSFEPEARHAEPMRRLDEEEERRRLALTWILFLEHYSRAYAGLASRDQRALALVEIDCLSYAEAGVRLAVGPSNMKMIMFRARQRLLGRMDRSMGVVRAEAGPQNPSLLAVG